MIKITSIVKVNIYFKSTIKRWTLMKNGFIFGVYKLEKDNYVYKCLLLSRKINTQLDF